MISAFLNHLETDRHNSTRTRNVRLTAIRSLFSYAALRHPEHALLIARVLAIPPERFDKRIVTFLTAAEVDALIAAPDQTRWEGRRDRALMLLAVQTGLRVSELTGLNCGDVTLGAGANVRCEGKGRKQRAVPLTGPVAGAAREPGSPNEPDARRPAVLRPAPDGGSAATPSRYASAPTPRPPRSTARRCPASESTRTSCATAARCRCCKPASTPPSSRSGSATPASAPPTPTSTPTSPSRRKPSPSPPQPTARPGRYHPPDKVARVPRKPVTMPRCKRTPPQSAAHDRSDRLGIVAVSA